MNENTLRSSAVSSDDALAKLRSALEEGEASGPPTPFDFDAFIARKLVVESARDE
jgi:Arc/MetJ-type ribon-helix-helix transcriptional regulator